MTNERPPLVDPGLLTDPQRCPACGGRLTGPRCPRCGVDLSGHAGRRIWELSRIAADSLAERANLITELRAAARARRTAPKPAGSAVPGSPAVPAAAVPPGRPAVPAGPVPAAGPAVPAVPAVPAGPVAPARLAAPAGTAARSVPGAQGLLLTLGAVLLGVALVAFLLVSWSRLDLAGRAAVVGGATVAVLVAAGRLARSLTATATALGALGAAMLLLDAWAVRATGLFGADQPGGLGYWSVALVCLILLLLGLAVVARLRVWAISAAVVGPIGGAVVATWLGTSLDAPAAALIGAWPAGAAVVLLAVTAAAHRAPSPRLRWALDGAPVALVGIGHLVFLIPAAVAALLRLGAAGFAALPVWRAEAADPVHEVLAGSVTGFDWTGLAIWAGTVTAAAVAAAVGAALPRLAEPGAVERPPLRRPARLLTTWALAVGALLLPLAPGLPVALSALLLAAVAAALLVGPGVPKLLRWCGVVAAGLALSLSWAVPVLSVIAMALLGAALLAARRRLPLGAQLPAAAGAVLSLGVSAGGGAGLFDRPLADRLAVLGACGAILGVLAVRGWGVRSLGWAAGERLAAGAAGAGCAAIAVLTGASAISASRLEVSAAGLDAGWPPLRRLAVLLVICLASALLSARHRTEGMAPSAAFGAGVLVPLAAGLLATARAEWASAAADQPALAPAVLIAALVGAAGVVLAVLASRGLRDERRSSAEVGTVLTAVAGVLAVSEAEHLWLVLLGWGVGAAAVATAPDRRRVGWLAGVLLTASSWARLAMSEVAVVELYTLPPAAALLTVGALQWRRSRRGADITRTGGDRVGTEHPFRVLVPGTALALGPSVVACAGGGDLRPWLLVLLGAGLVAAAVRFAGAAAGGDVAGGASERVTGAAGAELGTGELTTSRSTRSWRAPRPVAGLPEGTAHQPGPRSPLSDPIGSLLVLAALAGAAAAGGAAAARLLADSELLGAAMAGQTPTLNQVEVWALPAAAVMLVAGWLVNRWGAFSQPPIAALGPGVALAAAPSLIAAAWDAAEPISVVRAAAVLAAGLGLAVAAEPAGRRAGAEPAGAAASALVPLGLTTAAAAVLVGLALVARDEAASGPVEAWTLPLAAAAIWIGARALLRDPAKRSWAALAPGILLALLPGLFLAADSGTPLARQALLVVLATGITVLGAIRRWQAPLLLGSGVLALHAMQVLGPALLRLYQDTPRWIVLAAAGALLLSLGARYEQRLRDLNAVRLRLAAMR